MIKQLTFGILIWFLAAPGQADIYRCEIDGVIVFADTPCQQDAIPYQPSSGISVIEAPSNLDEIEAANQALIQRRLAQQAERAQAARQRTKSIQPQQVRREIAPYIPVYGRPLYHYPPYHHENRRRQTDPTRYVPEDSAPREQRYSALSGRLPGARRRADDE